VLGICVLYLIVGILINKFSRMKNGREVIPNVTFWISLPGLVAVSTLELWRNAPYISVQ